MRKLILWALAAALLIPGVAAAGTLKPGSDAPALQVGDWVKGGPISKFDRGRVYVVEFWATWCGPCRTTIPHLTKLAKANPDVPFIGVSVWEQGDDIPGQVRAFVAEMGDQMDYHVVLDKDDWMAESWMRAAGQNGIPTAFIVGKDGKIAWIGHPMRMDDPLAQIVAGTFDQAAFNQQFDAAQRAQAEAQEKRQRLASLEQMYAQGRKAEAIKGLDEMIAAQDDMALAAMMAKLRALSGDDPAGFEAYAGTLVKGDATHQAVLAQFAATTARAASQNEAMKARLPMALKAAQMLADAVENPDAVVCYYLALAFGEGGDKAKGREMAEKGIAAFDGDPSMSGNPQRKGLRDALVALKEKFSD